MSFLIPEEVLEDIQSRCDIVEIIGGYIPLKRAGNNSKALCPFHNEKTPSFVVSPSKQIYHCFGCGVGGNVFNFVMNYEHLDFVDAVKLLAEKTGVVIPENKGSINENAFSKGLWEVNKFASEFYHKCLFGPAGENAHQYLRDRGIEEDVIKKFLLGFAPSGNEFVKEASKKKFPDDLLIKAGLLVKSENKFVDMFRNRLMFPIFNHTGKVSGFSGRVLDSGLPKYINTPETPIFHKGKILYGFNAAKPEIIREDKVIICEGYFDFLRAYQAGVKNIAASQGTAFTQDHVHMIRRYASSIVICFDGDTAGSSASLRNLQMFLEEGILVKIAGLPKGHDPDTFIKEEGINKFRKLVGDAVDVLDVKLNRLCSEHNISSSDGKLKVISGILPDTLNIKSEIYKGQFIKKISNRLGVPEESIWLELKKLGKPLFPQRRQFMKNDLQTEKIITKLSECTGERHLVQLLLDDDPLPDEVMQSGIINYVSNPEYKMILELIINLKRTGRWKGVGSLAAHFKDAGLVNLISKMAASEEISETLDKMKNIRDCICVVKRRHKENKMKSLILKIEEKEKNKENITDLITEVSSLRKEMI